MLSKQPWQNISMWDFKTKKKMMMRMTTSFGNAKATAETPLESKVSVSWAGCRSARIREACDDNAAERVVVPNVWTDGLHPDLPRCC